MALFTAPPDLSLASAGDLIQGQIAIFVWMLLNKHFPALIADTTFF
jgi:hypothetical protein